MSSNYEKRNDIRGSIEIVISLLALCLSIYTIVYTRGETQRAQDVSEQALYEARKANEIAYATRIQVEFKNESILMDREQFNEFLESRGSTIPINIIVRNVGNSLIENVRVDILKNDENRMYQTTDYETVVVDKGFDTFIAKIVPQNELAEKNISIQTINASQRIIHNFKSLDSLAKKGITIQDLSNFRYSQTFSLVFKWMMNNENFAMIQPVNLSFVRHEDDSIEMKLFLIPYYTNNIEKLISELECESRCLNYE